MIALRNLLVALALLCGGLASSPANAACGDGASTCFWIPGAGAANWSATTNWSATSGGASCTCTPATGDGVVIDANSGTNGSTINNAISLSTFDASASSALTLTHNAVTLTITGNTFKFGASMTYVASANSRIVAFTSTSGTTAITSAGKTFGAIVANGAGGTFQPQDNMTILADTGTLTLTAGTFDANNKNLSLGSFLTTTAGTKVLTMGSGTWTVNTTGGTVWDAQTGTNLTINANTSNLAFSSAATSQRSFFTGGKTYATVTGANSGAVKPNFIISGNGATIGTLNNGGGLSFIQLPNSITITNFAVSGTSKDDTVFVSSTSTGGGITTITSAGASTPSWLTIQNLTFTGGGTFVANNSFNAGGLTGITVNGPSGSGGRIIGGSLRLPENDNTVCGSLRSGKIPSNDNGWLRQCG